MSKKQIPILLILLLAFSLRIASLTALPPGLTHDEANHGREALGILDGEFLFYFPLNYGSEPLYSYTVAGFMLLFGRSLFAMRLVNVLFGLGAMGIAYLWAKKAFDRRTALIAAAVTAVSFWPLASSREALRAGMLPFFIAAAVWFLWQFITREQFDQRRSRPAAIWPLLGFAISVTATLHIYLSSRVAWLMFPLFILYLGLVHRPIFRRTWQPTFLGLLLAGIMAVPMFSYVGRHPEVLTRLDMLDGPLQQIRSGNFMPLLENSRDALLAFIWPGYGDQFLAYNIPGRPVFDSLTAAFFAIGALVALWRWKQPAYAFVLLWFGAGIIPSLITGPTANTTRNLAAISAVHLLPAIGFVAAADTLSERFRRFKQPAFAAFALAWLAFAGWISARDYFVNWGQSAQVRGAYQHTLIESLAYLETHPDDSPVLLSSVYPGAAHDPSISMVMLPDPQFETRWVDARYALLFPNGADARAVIPMSTIPHPQFAGMLQETSSIRLRHDDLDPGFSVYKLDAASLGDIGLGLPVNFGGGVSLIDAHWVAADVKPGETAELITVWEVLDPDKVGPIAPPIYTTDVVLFTQLLDETGAVFSQRDALDAPSWDWRAGDILIQIHPLLIPGETPVGTYQAIVGIYDRLSGNRLPTLAASGDVIDNVAHVAPLEIKSP